jgi:hypothetical protein
MNIETEVAKKHIDLTNHPMYQSLTSLDHVKVFMKYHAFAVWDFMSLLKSLQRKITCVETPWTDSKYGPEAVRLINEIVIAEESDLDQDGNATSHFALYIKAMDEIGADTSLVLNFIRDYNFDPLPTQIKSMLAFHLGLAQEGKVHEVASSFFYGREKLIPGMFQSIVDILRLSALDCPHLIFYLERHIELDGEEHGPKALKCMNEILDSESEIEEALVVAKKSLDVRYELWDFIHQEMKSFLKIN